MFEEEPFDGSVCLRTLVLDKHLRFITEYYPYYRDGNFMNQGNVWVQPNKDIELVELITAYIKEYSGNS